MNESGHRRTLPDQSSGSGHTFDTSHHQSVTSTILSKRVCFYKSGDPQFNGLRVVINNRTFKTFDALLDSLSKKVPLPFGVRNITTPRGVHGIHTLDELEDGKSYICSDSRKVKPIDLALARRRLPPWYHARPVSSRRRTARFFPGRKNIRRVDPVVVRTPKKLVVFRNGDPSVRYTVLLHKKTTPSYESILGHISELMQFQVNKLHTPDGRRIDGLPGLILSSGSVVAVGREPFRPAVYNVEKSASPTRRRTKRRAFKRQKTSVSKKMTPSFHSNSRNFSASSERYLVHQIHNSIAESSCDLPTNSTELDSDRILESLTETEEDTCLGKGDEEGQDGALSNDDNIEKSFRVNQDGSMTVEMKVRLTIKEEETVQWTTTLMRSVTADQLNTPCLPDSGPEQELCSKSSQTSAASTDIVPKDRTRDDRDDDPPSFVNGAFSDSFQEEDDPKNHTEGVPPKRAPTPGCKKMDKLQASVDSITSVTVDEFGEGNVSSYCFREETNRTTTERIHMENLSSARPVPKPRRLGSMDVSSRDMSAFKSTEIIHAESSGEEVTETVLHIYEQQTCHDNFLANIGVHGMPAARATSETRQLSSSNDLELDPGVSSKLKPPSKHVRLAMTPGKRRRKTLGKAAEKRKRVKPFSSAVFIKRIYGNKKKPPKKVKKRATSTWNNSPKPNAKNVNVHSSLKDKTSNQMLWQSKNESLHFSKARPSPQFNSSSSVAKEYVENWLEKAHSNPSLNKVGTSETGKPLELPSVPNSIVPSVKLRVQSFENKSTPAVEKTSVRLQNADRYTNDYNSSSQRDTRAKPLLNEICSGMLPPRTETTEGSEEGNRTRTTSTVSMELLPPPPELLNAEDFENNDEASVSISPMSSQRSDIYQLSMSPASDKSISPDDNAIEKTSDTLAQQSVELSRAPSIKRAPLVSNRSLERKMSLRKATMDKYASDNDDSEELSTPINTVGDEICPTRTTRTLKGTSEETQQPTLELGTPSFCTSVSPLSLASDGRMSSSSVASSETSVLGKIPFQETKTPKTESPKSLMKSTKIKLSPPPGRKFHNKNTSDLPNTSPKLSPMTARLLDKHVLPTKRPETPNATLSTEKKYLETKELQRTSPYSQSLDVASPPVRHKSSKKPPPRNLASDSQSESKNRKPKKTASQRDSHQTAQMEADNCDEAKEAAGDRVISVTPEPTNAVNQLNMKPFLEKICYSIKSIRQITQNKRPSCLEKSNSLPDFSSHVASTFGSSSKVLLAFLAVMTLKEGLANLNMKELNANSVSCAEALKMIDSLREIANIEDSQRLRVSLSDLQQSASTQLLQSWRGFQELGDRCKSRTATPNASQTGLETEAGLELDCSIGEDVIDEIIDNLGIPQKLKEELASLSEGAEREGVSGGNTHSSTLKLLADQNIHENTKNIPTGDGAAGDYEQNVDVKSIVKKLTDINQPKQSERDRIPLFSEAGKYKPTGQANEDYRCQDWSNSVADSKNSPLEKEIYRTTSINPQSCRDATGEDNLETKKQHQQAYLSEKSTLERAKVSGDVCRKTKSVNPELYMDCRQPKQNEENILENKTIQGARSDLPEKPQKISSVNNDYCEQGSKKRAEHEISASSKLGSLSVEKQPDSNYYAEVNVKRKNAMHNSVSENLPEDDPAEIKSKLLQSQMYSIELNISTDEGTGSSDVEDPSSEAEQPEVDSKKLQVIIEESLSGNEEEEEDHLPLDSLSKFAEQTKKGQDLEALMEEPEEDQVSSEDEVQYGDELKLQSSLERTSISLLENNSLSSKRDDSSLMITNNLGKALRSNVDDDSGNEHSSFEEHVDKVQLKDETSSLEEELSYFEKDSSSEEEQAIKQRTINKSNAQKLQTPPRARLEESTHEAIVESPKQQPNEVITQSVAERITLLEKQVAEAQKPKLAPKSSTIRRLPERKSSPEVEDSPSESPTSELPLCTRSAPQSSLSFSYDSSSVITTEPEGSRVRSIREMFLARSATDVQQAGSVNTNSSQLRAETSSSGGYQSQTSADLSGNEDDPARKSISKGFVRRAIEMLYGKKDLEPEEASERSPPVPDQRKREASSIFSPFHSARSKAMSELSYFNSSNALDIFSEATRCIAFNAQVGPGDSVPIDDGRWLLRENTSMRKSVSDPVGINKTFTNTFHDDGLCKDTEEKTPYSLFSTKPELEDETQSQPGKCTYFSLPHASESEVCPDETSAASKDAGGAEETEDASADRQTWAERNGTLPGFAAADFKMKGNKVHPLVEPPPDDGEVVLVQPGKGQVVANRRIQEPDVLDLLYNFCGEHCPIL